MVKSHCSVLFCDIQDMCENIKRFGTVCLPAFEMTVHINTIVRELQSKGVLNIWHKLKLLSVEIQIQKIVIIKLIFRAICHRDCFVYFL